MRKIYSIAIVALCAFSATAGNFTELKELNRDALKLKNSTLEYAPASSVVAKAPMKATGSAPATIVGNSYVTVYSDGEIKCNGFIDVKAAANDSITLEGFAGGYDVKAKYDAATGTITIPTGVVIGNHSTYGNITMYALDAENKKYSSDPIIGTINDNQITFNYGVYGTVTAGLLIYMEGITASVPNGHMSFKSGQNSLSFPLLVSKTAENTVSIVGISSVLYGAYYSVPAQFDATANTASISKEAPVDYAALSSGARTYFLMGANSNNQLTGDLNFTVAATDNNSTLTATSNAGYVYVQSTDPLTGNKYGGYIFSDFKISVDYNIYTAKVEAGSTEFDPNPTINNIMYTLNPDTKTAEVTGCVSGINEINIPSKLTIQNVEYTVTSVKNAAFQANRTIKTISLPATIKTVGTDAFRNVSNLRTLYIEDLAAWCAVEFANGNANPIYNVFPTSERNWGKVYFNNTLFEGELNIPTGVTAIGRSFYGLKSLTKINFQTTVLKTIGDQAFANTTKLTEVAIPSSVTSVGSAFFGCSALAKVTLAEGLETMGNNMFYGCKALTEISVPATVKSIGSSTFMSCSNITSITSLSTVPPTATALSFDYFYENATLKVPAGAIDAYKAAEGWKVFTKVEALPSSGVEGVEADVNAPVEYYNLQGQKVAAESLVPGIYVIRQGNKASKVLVK